GELRLQGHGGYPVIRPIGGARRRRSSRHMLRGEWRAEVDQRRLEDHQGRSGRRQKGVLRHLRQSLRITDRRQGRRNGHVPPAPTFKTRRARRHGLPLERRVWVYGRLYASERHRAPLERRTLTSQRPSLDDCRPAPWLIAIRAEFLSNNHFDLAIMFMAIGDSAHAFLRFRANKQTIERIVTRARLYEIDENMFKRQADSKSPPIYWKPFEGKPTLFCGSQ